MGRHKLEDLRDVLAELAQRAAALGTGRVPRHMRLDLARQVLRQRPPDRSILRRRNGIGRRFALRQSAWGRPRFQVFQPQFKLLNLVVELLALAPKLHPPQLQDEQFQILDFGVPRDEFGVLLDDQRPQCRRVQRAQFW